MSYISSKQANLKSIFSKACLDVSEAGGAFKCNNLRRKLYTIIICKRFLNFSDPDKFIVKLSMYVSYAYFRIKYKIYLKKLHPHS